MIWMLEIIFYGETGGKIMNNTPVANRKHIAIFGKRNSGKSSLMNAIIGQEISIVSDTKGTTTDPVSKTMELIPFGPVIFIDTAGIDDEGELGNLRIEKSKRILNRTDLALYVIEQGDYDFYHYENLKREFKKYNIPYITVINKADYINADISNYDFIEKKILVSAKENLKIHDLKNLIIDKLSIIEEEIPLLGDLLPYGSTVLMVVPVDSEAPKGRLILPQVQLIRECLDYGIKSYVVRDTELKQALDDINKIDLVVTDSQAFKYVESIIPIDMKLTGFSTLFARHKGDLKEYIRGIENLKKLDEDSRILISESCSHNHSHEDIGRVKIPKLLQEKLGKKLNFTFKMGHDFPRDVGEFDFVIHCGSCMLNRKTMITRTRICSEKGIEITNYGLVLAYVNGIFDRSIEIFEGTY